jgi:hypothetical protein
MTWVWTPAILCVAVLLLLKAIEMAYHCYRILRRDSEWNADDRSEWPIFKRLRMSSILGFLFRLPLLVLAGSLLLAVPTWPTWVFFSGGLLLFVSMWIQLAQALLSRYIHGEGDVAFRKTSTSASGFPGDRQPRSDAQVFVKFISGLIALIIAGYSGVFVALSHLRCKAFCPPLTNYVDSFYFSLGTFATVGYGDIKPVSHAARGLVSSEIVSAMACMVILVLEYSMSVQRQDH